MPFCGNCGSEVQAENKFCVNCGKPIILAASSSSNQHVTTTNTTSTTAAATPSVIIPIQNESMLAKEYDNKAPKSKQEEESELEFYEALES